MNYIKGIFDSIIGINQNFHDYNEDSNCPLLAVYDIHISNINPIQIIVVNEPPPDFVANFDLSICKIYHNGDELFASDSFLETEKTKVIQVRRISEKYPGLAIENRPDFERGINLLTNKTVELDIIHPYFEYLEKIKRIYPEFTMI